jgi:hypothetical protein
MHEVPLLVNITLALVVAFTGGVMGEQEQIEMARRLTHP